MHSIIINLSQPGSTAEDVRRCLSVLYGSRAGEQALDREFGISWECLDNPPPVAQALLAQEILAKTARYEPRARITNVDYDFDAPEGVMIPRVTVEVVKP